MDSLPQLSLGTAALIIFAICAGFVLLRGLTRMFVGTLVLGLSAWIGFRVWQIAPSLSVDWTGKSLDWITNGLPIVAFLGSLIIIRVIVNAVVQPFRKPSGNSMPRSLAGTMFRLVFALIPTSLIFAIVAAMVHHSAAVADVRATSEKSDRLSKAHPESISQRLQSAMAAKVPESWLRMLDPLSDPSRLALAKLIAAQSESTSTPVINPETGKPYPRAIIVDEPTLQKLAREGKFDTLLRHPLLTKALADPKVQNALKSLQP